MTMREPHFYAPQEPQQHNYAMYKLNKLQTEMIAAARMLAIEEVGAAVAHQLNEPLTALLLYLNELKRPGEQFASPYAATMPAWEIVAKAAREAERACEILERARNGLKGSSDTQSAVACGREALDAWTYASGQIVGNCQESTVSPVHLAQLTPREQEVLTHITAGTSNKEGAHRLGISVRTFEVHRAHIMRKVGAKNAADLVRTVLTNANSFGVLGSF